MYGNALLQYYKQGFCKNGFLDADKIDAMRNMDLSVFSVRPYDIDGKRYYFKMHSRDCSIQKSRADAEILLSQIYNKAGISSAIYLPADNNGKQFLLSDDVQKPNVQLAMDYINRQYQATGQYKTPFLSNGSNNASLYFTENAMKQQTLLRILDTASFNIDRHTGNIFYVLEQDDNTPACSQNNTLGSQIVNVYRSFAGRKDNLSQQDEPKSLNKADDVIAIDFESSGTLIEKVTLEPSLDYSETFDNYINDFKLGSMKREEMLEEFRINEKLAELIDKPAVAEVIGSLNPSAVAQDIKEVTGYEIDRKMVDVLSYTYDEMAETLIQ